MAPADNERRRRAAASLFAVAKPTAETRLQWIEEDAAHFVKLLETGKARGIADMRRWADRHRFVCDTVLAEPAPPSLGRLIKILMGVKDRPRSDRKNRAKYNAAVEYVARNPDASPSQIKRGINYDQQRVIKQWLASPEFKAAVEQRRLTNK